MKKAAKSDKALKKVEQMLLENRDYGARITTTQAVDLIGGGVKINALPEQAWAVINHRIMTQRYFFVSCDLYVIDKIFLVPSTP